MGTLPDTRQKLLSAVNRSEVGAKEVLEDFDMEYGIEEWEVSSILHINARCVAIHQVRPEWLPIAHWYYTGGSTYYDALQTADAVVAKLRQARDGRLARYTNLPNTSCP